MIHKQKCDFLDECGVRHDDQISPERLAFLGLPAKRLQFVKYMGSLGSNNLSRNEQADIMNRHDWNVATDQEKETAQKELREIELLEQCLLMSDFLLQCMEKNGFADKLKKQWQSQPVNAVSLELLEKVADQNKQIGDLFRTAKGLAVENLSKCEDYDESILILDGKQTVLLKQDRLKRFVRSAQIGKGKSLALKKLRMDKLAEDDPQKWRENEAYEKVKSVVGQELLASTKMMKRTNVGILNRIFGKTLKFVNWIFRKKRKNHGEQNCDACKKLFEKKLGNIDSVLNDWQRGDEGLSPVGELRQYYEDSFKVQI